MKMKFLTLICILIANFLAAQTEQLELPKLIPPSPNAFELGKYGKIPIGMFTGAINYEIPICTFKANKLTLPISLHYNSNGIKVDQISSNVGLGWSLNAGGVVTRIVRDQDDQDNQTFFPKEDIISGFHTNPIAMQYFHDAAEGSDSESDMYMFNFDGYSGQFVFDHNQKIVIIPYQKLKIEPNADNEDGGFTIVAPNGNKYIFNDTEKTMPTLHGSSHPIPAIVVSAWYLSEIIHPTGDTIKLTYENENYSYDIGISESINTIPVSGGCSGGTWVTATNSFVPVTQVRHHNHIIGKKLSVIKSNRPEFGEIDFTYEQTDPEINGHSFVKEITVYSSDNNREIEKYSLSYLMSENKRSFLKSIIQLDTSSKYIFDYEAPEDLPKRFVQSMGGGEPQFNYRQDHWGYFNNKANTTLVPKPDNSDLYINFTNAANREPDHNYTVKGLLKKITYPTKGYNEIVYEPNTYHGNLTITPPRVTVELDTSSNDQWGTQFTVSRQIYSPCNQRADIDVTVVFDSLNQACSGDTGHSRAYFEIKDNTDNQIVQLYIINGDGSQTNINYSFSDTPSLAHCYRAF